MKWYSLLLKLTTLLKEGMQFTFPPFVRFALPCLRRTVSVSPYPACKKFFDLLKGQDGVDRTRLLFHHELLHKARFTNFVWSAGKSSIASSSLKEKISMLVIGTSDVPNLFCCWCSWHFMLRIWDNVLPNCHGFVLRAKMVRLRQWKRFIYCTVYKNVIWWLSVFLNLSYRRSGDMEMNARYFISLNWRRSKRPFSHKWSFDAFSTETEVIGWLFLKISRGFVY